jgi:hypothetical protein
MRETILNRLVAIITAAILVACLLFALATRDVRTTGGLL